MEIWVITILIWFVYKTSILPIFLLVVNINYTPKNYLSSSDIMQVWEQHHFHPHEGGWFTPSINCFIKVNSTIYFIAHTLYAHEVYGLGWNFAKERHSLLYREP